MVALLVLFLVLWLPSFPGRLALFMLALARPESWPNPQGLLSSAPQVGRIEFPSTSGRRIVADIYSPGGGPQPDAPRPAILLFTPASRDGLNNPGVRRAAECFARLGYVVMVPFPYGRQIAHVSIDDVADAHASLDRFLHIPGVDRSRSVGAGLSYGSGPLLLAASKLPPSRQPSRFLVLGGYADLREALRFATTGAYGFRSMRGQHVPSPYVRQILGRTLVAWAGRSDRPLLTAIAEGGRSTPPGGLSPAGRSLARLFLNQDPDRFDALYAELPASTRSKLDALTVSRNLDGLAAPVYIIHPRNDRFVPASEALRLWDALPASARGAVVLPSALPHGLPLREDRQYLRSFRSIWQVYRLAGRALYPTRAELSAELQDVPASVDAPPALRRVGVEEVEAGVPLGICVAADAADRQNSPDLLRIWGQPAGPHGQLDGFEPWSRPHFTRSRVFSRGSSPSWTPTVMMVHPTPHLRPAAGPALSHAPAL